MHLAVCFDNYGAVRFLQSGGVPTLKTPLFWKMLLNLSS